eukprot:TRINITY_DN12307_c0_g1_i4.p1 TRINITY_DN12307_c0_g1~~TRINITY_DN12307_c0_g1_i4.p1  ORF type:complete len:107 (+),score=11.32 TRINITY_DN12307_c0_g1_i4:361-681(+)
MKKDPIKFYFMEKIQLTLASKNTLRLIIESQKGDTTKTSTDIHTPESGHHHHPHPTKAHEHHPHVTYIPNFSNISPMGELMSPSKVSSLEVVTEDIRLAYEEKRVL